MIIKATVLNSWNFPAKTPTAKILSKITTVKCKSERTEKSLKKESLDLDPPAAEVLDGKDGSVVAFAATVSNVYDYQPIDNVPGKKPSPVMIKLPMAILHSLYQTFPELPSK